MDWFLYDRGLRLERTNGEFVIYLTFSRKSSVIVAWQHCNISHFVLPAKIMNANCQRMYTQSWFLKVSKNDTKIFTAPFLFAPKIQPKNQ